MFSACLHTEYDEKIGEYFRNLLRELLVEKAVMTRNDHCVFMSVQKEAVVRYVDFLVKLNDSAIRIRDVSDIWEDDDSKTTIVVFVKLSLDAIMRKIAMEIKDEGFVSVGTVFLSLHDITEINFLGAILEMSVPITVEADEKGNMYHVYANEQCHKKLAEKGEQLIHY